MTLDLLTLGETLISLTAAEPGRIESVRTLRKTIGGTEVTPFGFSVVPPERKRRILSASAGIWSGGGL